MRICSDHLTAADIAQAIRAARDEDKQDIYLTDPITAHKSRKRHASFVVFCHSAHGRYATAHRPIGSYPLDAYPRAASWDAYGYMMARLFAKDPDAIVGWYDGVHDFRRAVLRARRPLPTRARRELENRARAPRRLPRAGASMKRALAIVSAAVAMSGAGAYVTSFHASPQGAQTAQQLTSHAPAGGWNAYLTRAVLSEAGTP